METKDNARGEGQGIGMPKVGDGGATKCVCPNKDCGFEGPHVKGTPCNTQTCPKCGAKLIGK